MGETGCKKCEGEYESLKAIHAISPGFAPKPYAWGKYKNKESEAYFLLEEFRDIREQVSTLEFLFQPRHLIQLWIARRPGQTRNKTCRSSPSVQVADGQIWFPRQNVAWRNRAGCGSMG